MEFTIDLTNLNATQHKIDAIKFQKMLLLYNAIEHGWSVKKRNNSFVFSKHHENKKEIMEESYLLKFMNMNMDLKNIFS
jgi:hypothetical protein